MGLFSAVCILVGTVIGSGIFTTPGQIAISAGSFGPNMLAWVIAGVSGDTPSFLPPCQKPEAPIFT
ncbi:hypothetical protein AALA46_16030 [Enterocloster aldenensis]|uniref:hypothetical protein n=1 Tax=Enterocloster aldenensis TaxID=358742 RepID=UPI0025A327A5|nr:hypothetical protein [uncultured Lachnoclostridium sp.]MDM8294606.1 hypothetical protein [Enterocloster aldenensis]